MTEKEVVETLKQAIDLIESQQAKINKLEKARQKQDELLCELREQKYELMGRISTVKRTAYKKLVMALMDEVDTSPLKAVSASTIYKVFWQMVGDGK